MHKPVANSANISIFMSVEETISPSRCTHSCVILFHTSFLICFVLFWSFRSLTLSLIPSFGLSCWLYTWVDFFLNLAGPLDSNWEVLTCWQLTDITRALTLFNGWKNSVLKILKNVLSTTACKINSEIYNNLCWPPCP